MSKIKVVRWAYLKLIRKREIKPVACEKWQLELQLPEDYDWDTVFNRTYIITDDRKLRWLQFQCLHRFLPTNKRLHMYGLVESNKCRNCPMYQETIAHMFWHCHYVLSFWREFQTTFAIRGDLSIEKIICGFKRGGRTTEHLNLLLLIAKHFIWNCRVCERPITFQTFVSQLQQYSDVGKHIAHINNNLEKYERLWKPINEAIGLN